MSKFSVTGTVVRDFQIDVDAEDEELALDVVESMSHIEFHETKILCRKIRRVEKSRHCTKKVFSCSNARN